MNTERRRFTRVPVRIPVRIFLAGQQDALEGEISNISVGGAFIYCKKKINTGQKILLELKLAQLELLHCKVTAVEMDPNESETKEQESVVRWINRLKESGIGVEFIDLKPATKSFLEKMVDVFEKNQE